MVKDAFVFTQLVDVVINGDIDVPLPRDFNVYIQYINWPIQSLPLPPPPQKKKKKKKKKKKNKKKKKEKKKKKTKKKKKKAKQKN